MFESLCDRRRFVRPLEPSQVLLVEPPTLLLQLSRSQVLEVGTGAVVEDVEEGVDVELREEGGRTELRRGLLGVVRRCRVRCARHVVLWPRART